MHLPNPFTSFENLTRMISASFLLSRCFLSALIAEMLRKVRVECMFCHRSPFWKIRDNEMQMIYSVKKECLQDMTIYFFIVAFLRKTETKSFIEFHPDLPKCTFLFFLRVVARIRITIFLTYHCHFVLKETLGKMCWMTAVIRFPRWLQSQTRKNDILQDTCFFRRSISSVLKESQKIYFNELLVFSILLNF